MEYVCVCVSSAIPVSESRCRCALCRSPQTEGRSGYDVHAPTGERDKGDSGYNSGAVNQRVDTLHSRVVELEHSVDRALSSCLDQELRIQLVERVTYNGVLLWKIDEFERRRKEAVDGITPFLTPFPSKHRSYENPTA